MTKIQLLATLLALFIFAMLGACSNEDYPEPDVFKVTPDLRTRINTGIKMASRTEKRLFNETFNSFLHKCDEMGSEKYSLSIYGNGRVCRSEKANTVILSRYLLFVNGPLPKTKSPFLLFHSERSDRNSLPQYSG